MWRVSRRQWRQLAVDESDTIRVYRFKKNRSIDTTTSLLAYPTKEQCAAALSQHTWKYAFLTEDDFTMFPKDILKLSKV